MRLSRKTLMFVVLALVLLAFFLFAMSIWFIKPPTISGRDLLPEDLPKIDKVRYNVNVAVQDDTKIELPYGIVCFNDQIIVADKQQHCLLVLDKMYNIVNKIGKLGSARNEFCEPTGLTADAKHIYVLDAGNSQIKILDETLNFVDYIQLPVLDHHQGGYRYIDIACTNNGILYVSNNSPGQNDARILMINNKIVKKLPLLFNGFLASTGKVIYAANQLEQYTLQGIEGSASGISCLYEIDKDKYELKFTYPNKYVPCDLLYQNHAIITSSYTWGRIDQIDLQQKKMTGVANLRIQDLNCYIAFSQSDEILVCDSSAQTIYKLS